MAAFALGAAAGESEQPLVGIPNGESPWGVPMGNPRGESPWDSPQGIPMGNLHAESPWGIHMEIRFPMWNPYGESLWVIPMGIPHGYSPWHSPWGFPMWNPHGQSPRIFPPMGITGESPWGLPIANPMGNPHGNSPCSMGFPQPLAWIPLHQANLLTSPPKISLLGVPPPICKVLHCSNVTVICHTFFLTPSMYIV